MRGEGAQDRELLERARTAHLQHHHARFVDQGDVFEDLQSAFLHSINLLHVTWVGRRHGQIGSAKPPAKKKKEGKTRAEYFSPVCNILPDLWFLYW